MKIKVIIDSEGTKPYIYGLKQALEKFFQQYSCNYHTEILDDRGKMVEISSGSISVPSVQSEDVIDAEVVELSGDGLLALIEHKEE